MQVGQMKDAIVAGRGVRVTLWNMTAKREGFWNCLAIYPSHDGRYFLSVQAKPATIVGIQPATLYIGHYFLSVQARRHAVTDLLPT